MKGDPIDPVPSDGRVRVSTIKANPSKITFDDETIFGVTKVTLSTISYNVYDTEWGF